MTKLVSLCKRRGFVFSSSEIYGGLKSAYDYGHLGVELKKNIADLWWRQMVHERDDVVGFDASIIMHSKVWEASGHLAGFFDPLVDCLNCKQRFRADKAPRRAVGERVGYRRGGKKNAQLVEAEVSACGYVCPFCSAPTLSAERQFNLMFRTNLGAIDPNREIVEAILRDETLSAEEIRKRLRRASEASTVYLRPETAQAMFVQFANVLQTSGMKLPFGIAQLGKSFRNEIVTEHFIFRSCEFEQMELEYFIVPDTWQEQLDYWKDNRLQWYQKLANDAASFRLRRHERDELAHYAQDCFDVEFAFPWGWDELEGVASRGDYDLRSHQQKSGAKLNYFDPHKVDPRTGKQGYRYTPYVIEPSAGLTRGVLAFLLDAYCEDRGVDHQGREKRRMLLKLHPLLAPYKGAVLPLVKDEAFVRMGKELAKTLKSSGLYVIYDDNQSIGKRYTKHDEIGTPFCVTIDAESIGDGTVTVRDRDTTAQERVASTALGDYLRDRVQM